MLNNERKLCKQLTVSQKLEIMEEIEKGVSLKHLASEFGVTVRTIYNIKKDAVKLRQEVKTNPTSNKKKRLREPIASEIDKQLYSWFLQQSTLGDIISDRILLEKAREFSENCNDPSTFVCNRGWIWRFKKRHGIRSLQMQGKSADIINKIAEDLSTDLLKYLEEANIDLNNVYKTDENWLTWKSLPRRKLIQSTVKTLSVTSGIQKRRDSSTEERNEKEEEKEEEFRDKKVEKALDLIAAWSKQYDCSVQLHANVLKDFFHKKRIEKGDVYL